MMNKSKSVLVIVLVAAVILTAFPQQAQASEVCQRALEKCTVDAIISFLLGGGLTAGIMMSGCLNGYSFCLKYLKV